MNPTSTQVLHWLHRPMPHSLSLLSILRTLLVVAAIIIILQVLHFLLLCHPAFLTICSLWKSYRLMKKAISLQETCSVFFEG